MSSRDLVSKNIDVVFLVILGIPHGHTPCGAGCAVRIRCFSEWCLVLQQIDSAELGLGVYRLQLI